MKPTSSRRDFLTGKAAADAGALPDPDRQSPPNPPAGPSYLVHVARRAMACEFEVRFNAGQYEHDTETALEVLDLVETLEDQMSVFRQTSEICHINRTAGREPVKVEPGLFELLELAVRLHGETQGAFDITAGPLSEVWGFARRAGAVPTDEQLAEALRCVGSHLLQLDPERKTIRFGRQGVRLNLGSIGKGYALDRCAERLHQAGIEDFLLHGGHSSVLGRGSQRWPRHVPPDDPSWGWLVGLRHPLRPRRRLAEIRLRDQALATSGSRLQSFVHRGRRYGHILDPRSGRPAEGVLSTTVIAPTAALADALSTAFYVMGPQLALDYCRTRPEIGGVLVCPAHGHGGFEIRTTGLAEGQLRLL
jgi:thiamine biosynthesis lipoprotein